MSEILFDMACSIIGYIAAWNFGTFELSLFFYIMGTLWAILALVNLVKRIKKNVR